MAPPVRRPFRVAVFLALSLLAVGIAVLGARGRLLEALALLIFLVLGVALVVLDDRLPVRLHFLVAVALLVNAGGWVLGWFDAVPGYDEIAHLYTPFAVTPCAALLAYRPALGPLGERRWRFGLAVATLGITIGALWEMAEWVAYSTIEGVHLQGLQDSMIDLAMDSLGAVAAVPLAFWGKRHVRRGPA